MKNVFFLLVILSPSSLHCAGVLPGATLQNPPTALLRVAEPDKWSAGITYEREHRQLRIVNVEDLEARRLGVFITHSPLPWLLLEGGAGTAIAEIDGREASYGVDWRGGIKIGLLEHILEQSPVRGTIQLFRLDISSDYRRARSNFSDADFFWQEWRFMPSVTYLETLDTLRRQRRFQPESTAIHLGMLFSRIHGRHGGVSLSENRNFGLRAGGDIRFISHWTAFADILAYHASETSFRAGLRRQF